MSEFDADKAALDNESADEQRNVDAEVLRWAQVFRDTEVNADGYTRREDPRQVAPSRDSKNIDRWTTWHQETPTGIERWVDFDTTDDRHKTVALTPKGIAAVERGAAGPAVGPRQQGEVVAITSALTRADRDRHGRTFFVEQPPAPEWSVERYPGFQFRGGTFANVALTDLVIMRKEGEPAVVVATERDDNPGVSVTNGAEQLAAAVIEQHFPGHRGTEPPFTFIEHYPSGPESYKEVVFADYFVRRDRLVPRIGDVKEWRTVNLEAGGPQQRGEAQSFTAAISRTNRDRHGNRFNFPQVVAKQGDERAALEVSRDENRRIGASRGLKR